MNANRQYENMFSSAAAKLANRRPEDIAAKANVHWDAGRSAFLFETLGQPITVRWPECTFDAPLEMWHGLTVLQYLSEADGSPLGEDWISLQEFAEGGLIRGGSFDRENERIFREALGQSDVNALAEAAAKLGGAPIAGKADFSAVFPFMPNFPLALHVWLADEEFPASCKILCNRSAEHYLKVEAAGTASAVLLHQLARTVNRCRG